MVESNEEKGIKEYKYVLCRNTVRSRTLFYYAKTQSANDCGHITLSINDGKLKQHVNISIVLKDQSLVQIYVISILLFNYLNERIDERKRNERSQ